MAEKLVEFDVAKHLESEDDIAAYMTEAFETGDSAYIAHALGVVARARGMSQLAKDAGLSREQLYKTFSEGGNPTLKTLMSVMKALGVVLVAKPADHDHDDSKALA